MDLIENLKWRSLYKDTTDIKKLEKAIEEKSAFYLGIDPTADSIHIGHLLSINLMRILVSYGLKPILIIGGATASIGDPSGKKEERKKIDTKELSYNISSLSNQLEDIINNNKKTFGKDVLLLNNWKWYKNMDLVRFLRDYGKNINISSMISKDNVKKRIGTGISFTEFSYQLIQGYDWLYLRENHGAKIQIGGSDQWGNIVSGTELIRKTLGINDVAGMTVELLLDSSGNKIGKTSSGEVIWLDEGKTSSFKLYQYIRNQNDEVAKDLVKKLTLINKEEFDSLNEKHLKSPKDRLFQNYIAEYLIGFLDYKCDYKSVLKMTEAVYSGNYSDLTKIEIDEIFNETGGLLIDKFNEIPLNEMIRENKINVTARELREQIENNSVFVNDNPIASSSTIIYSKDLIKKEYLILRISKKKRIILKTK